MLVFTFLFLFSGSVYGDEFQYGLDAIQIGDPEGAVKWFSKSAVKGNIKAQLVLGEMYDKGLGVPQDYKEAFKWLSLAAGQGSAKGQHYLGYMYYNGKGAPQDYKEAVKWISLAAEQGNSGAQTNLGFLYKNGLGVIKDSAQAHKWFNIASANGVLEAIKGRNEVEKQMSRSQIAEVQRLARRWVENHKK